MQCSATSPCIAHKAVLQAEHRLSYCCITPKKCRCHPCLFARCTPLPFNAWNSSKPFDAGVIAERTIRVSSAVLQKLSGLESVGGRPPQCWPVICVISECAFAAQPLEDCSAGLSRALPWPFSGHCRPMITHRDSKKWTSLL